MQVESQAAQIQELRATCEQLQVLCQEANQRVRETKTTADALIEQLRQQVQDATEVEEIAQFHRTSTNREPGRARTEGVNEAQIALDTPQGMRLQSLISLRPSQYQGTERRVTFFRSQSSENEMSDVDDGAPFKQFSQKNKGKGRASEPWSDDNEEV